MHEQNCCFAHRTYCFLDVAVAVAVKVSQGPYSKDADGDAIASDHLTTVRTI